MSTPFDMLRGFSYAHQMGEEGRQRGLATYVNRLAGEAYGAAPEQRQPALARLISADAGTGTQMASYLDRGDEAKRQRQAETLARHARVAAQLPPDQLAQAWPTLRARVMADDPELGAMLSEQYDEATVRPILAQFAGQADGGVSVRSSFVGDDGQMYSIMSDGSVKAQGVGADRKLQAFDVPGVGPQVVDLRNATARGVTREGMGAPRSAPASTFAFTPAPGAEGSPAAADFQNLPPDQQQVAAQLLQRGQDFTIQGGRVVPAAMRGGKPMGQQAPTLDRVPISEVGGGEDRPAWVRPASGGRGDASAPAGYRFSADGQTLEAIPGGPADKPDRGATPPSGYRFAADGRSLEPIPGGPAAKPSGQGVGGKPLAGEARMKLGMLRAAREALNKYEQEVLPQSGGFNESRLFTGPGGGYLDEAINNVLRVESGAAVPEEETKRGVARYGATIFNFEGTARANAQQLRDKIDILERELTGVDPRQPAAPPPAAPDADDLTAISDDELKRRLGL